MTEKEPEKQNFKAAALKHSDAKLLAGCRCGEEAAWNTLVERFERLVTAIRRLAGLS